MTRILPATSDVLNQAGAQTAGIFANGIGMWEAVTVASAGAFAAIIFGSYVYKTTEKERERTKRDVAAYMAEGSISTEDAERVLSARPPKK